MILSCGAHIYECTVLLVGGGPGDEAQEQLAHQHLVCLTHTIDGSQLTWRAVAAAVHGAGAEGCDLAVGGAPAADLRGAPPHHLPAHGRTQRFAHRSELSCESWLP